MQFSVATRTIPSSLTDTSATVVIKATVLHLVVARGSGHWPPGWPVNSAEQLEGQMQSSGQIRGQPLELLRARQTILIAVSGEGTGTRVTDHVTVGVWCPCRYPWPDITVTPGTRGTKAT